MLLFVLRVVVERTSPNGSGNVYVVSGVMCKRRSGGG